MSNFFEREPQKITITPDIMRINTRGQAIDIQQIDNRRFMYNPKTKVLVLGSQSAEKNSITVSHATELADAGITEGFDDFVRGWVGTGYDYPKGVIHFAPNVEERNLKLFDHAFDTLEMFAKNGALAETVIRGFGSHWEQPLSCILTPEQESECKLPVRGQQKPCQQRSTTDES